MNAREKKIRRRKRRMIWLPHLILILIRLLNSTIRLRIQMPEATRKLLQSDQPLLLAFWHGQMFLMPLLLQQGFLGARQVWTLVSQHWDGELIARIASFYGVPSIRGSSTRGGPQAYREMVERMRAGATIAITPDGPRGPREQVQSGIVKLSRSTGIPIVPVSWKARPMIRFKSWDRLQLPFPFARVSVAIGEPLQMTEKKHGGGPRKDAEVLGRRLRHLTCENDTRVRQMHTMQWLSRGYNILLFFVSLLALPFFMWKLISVPKHRAGFFQRLGFYAGGWKAGGKTPRPLWVHAVSVGEVLATIFFVRRMRETYPKYDIVASTITPTGQAVAQKHYSDVRRIVFFPFDFPGSVRLALRSVRPRLFIHTETEIWPNFLFVLGEKGIPSAIVNGRISERSSRQYGWFRFFFRSVLSNISVFGMQSKEDCYRLLRIGADPRRVHVTGNMKFDVSLPDDTKGRARKVRNEMGISENVLIIVCGSTHEGEEDILFDVYARLKITFPELRMLLAPRHPERCDEVELLAIKKGTSIERRTLRKAVGGEVEADVLLLDTIGELARAYSIADIVFVGGSLVPVGGHNLLEPIVYKKPVLFGPYVQNAPDIAYALEEVGGGFEVFDRETLFREAERLMADPARRAAAGQAAYEILEEHRGATERNLAIIRPFLET